MDDHTQLLHAILAKLDKIDVLSDKIDGLSDRITSLEELRTDVQDLTRGQDSLAEMYGPHDLAIRGLQKRA